MPDYCERSYFEALVNSLVHRDYLVNGSEVHIDIFDDRLRIYSPGGMPDGTLVQERIIDAIPSTRRNPVLADVFQRLGYMERKGSGLTKIIESYKNAYNYSEEKKPQFESSRVEFSVTLMNLNYGVNEANEANEAKNVTGKIQDIEILLLNILRENPNVTQKELARITGVSRSTIQRLMEVFYVHGSMNEIENGIVLGINADQKDQQSNMDLRFVRFKKYYQRIQKGTSFRLNKMLNKESVNHLHIVGHSLDITDKDILTGLIMFENTVTTVYYHSNDAKNEQIAKLILLFGKDKFEELLNDEKIEFQRLCEFEVNNPKDTEIEEYELYEEDYFEYKLQHDCRIIEEDRFSGTILCGNELVNIGVREEGGLGYAEMEIVDYFLWRIEFFNHSGKYKGVVAVDEIFNDDRYGSVSVKIKYLLPKGVEQDISEAELKQLLDTEFKCNPMFVYEVSFEELGNV